MKKLMIAAAIVCAAVVTQAATINWGNNTEASGLPDGWASEGAWYGLYQLSGNIDAASITAIDATTHALTITGGSATLLDSHVVTADEYDGGAFQGTYEGNAADLNGKYYAIVLMDTTQNEDYASSGTYTISGLDDAGAAKFLSIGNGGDGTQITQTGVTFATEIAENGPEPTSGLLLLLGVAGLALKRKHA